MSPLLFRGPFPPIISIYKASASGSPIHPPLPPTFPGKRIPKATQSHGSRRLSPNWGIPMRRFFWGWPWIQPRKLHDGWMVEEIRWVNSPVDIRYISLLFYRVFWYIPTGANMSSWRWMVQILNSFLNGWFVGSSCESSRLHSAPNMDPNNNWFAKFGMSFSSGKTTILRGKFC